MTGNQRRFFWGAAALGLALLMGGCKAKVQKPNYLVGHWQVFMVVEGNDTAGGPAFHGSEFTFRQNGTVFSETYGGDTLTLRYELRGDTLVYLQGEMEEKYMIDSLGPTRLVVSINRGGPPVVAHMLRVTQHQ